MKQTSLKPNKTDETISTEGVQLYPYSLKRNAYGEPQQVTIRKGPMANISFRYGKVHFDDDSDGSVIRFEYDIVKNPNNIPISDTEFGIISKILIDILKMLHKEKKRKGIIK